jgi:hypothetical protein
MEQTPFPYVLVVVLLAGAALVAWVIGIRYFRDRPSVLTAKEKAVGFMLAGPFFGPLHSSLSARGYKLSTREKIGLGLILAMMLIAIIGSVVFGHGVRGA